MKRKIISCILVVVCCIGFSLAFFGCSSSYKLPSHLYNLSSKYIAYTYEGKVYNRNTQKFLAKFDYKRKIFVDKYGKYYGEIILDKTLVYNQNSEYVDMVFDEPTDTAMAPLAPLPPMIPNIPTQPSYIIDVNLYN